MGDEENLDNNQELENDVEEAESSRGKSFSLDNILSNKKLLAIIGVGFFVFILLLFLIFSGGGRVGGMHYVEIINNLTAQDSALIRAELRYANIPSRTSGSGKNLIISVPVKHRQDAMSILALRGLPGAPIEGFRLFDKQDGLGSTDFDKKVKFLRAQSGELALIIMRLDDVEDARVNIVMPDKQIFSRRRENASASVLLKTKNNKKLPEDKVNGIVQLIINSVEGLSPDNISILDTTGNLLYGNYDTFIRSDLIITPNYTNIATPNIITINENQQLMMVTENQEDYDVMLERIVYNQFKVKNDMEKDLERRTKDVLQHFLPQESTIVKVNVVLAPIFKNDFSLENLTEIDKISILILVDSEAKNINLSWFDKKNIFSAIAEAVGYRYNSEDRIVLKRAPFFNKDLEDTYAVTNNIAEEEVDTKEPFWERALGFINNVKDGNIDVVFIKYLDFLIAIIALLFFILFLIVYKYKKAISKREIDPFSGSNHDIGDIFDEKDQDLEQKKEQEEIENKMAESEELKEIRSAVNKNPEQIADLMKKWINEDQ